jgi:DNA ligase (NAD+)
MSQDRAEELEKRIREAREAYYNLDPIMSDPEYDAILGELQEIRPKHEQIVAVGATPTQLSVWEKVEHEIPMGSLNKANSEKELDEWAEKAVAGTYHITHKIDGSSMELVYRAGALVRCVTRGDGRIGEDVTANVSKVPSVPKQLPVEIDVTVRGEIVMMKGVFQEKYAEKYANPRNTAAAKVREKKGGGAACEDLEFLAYWATMQDRPHTMFFLMKWLENHGFKVPDSSASTGLDPVKEVFRRTAGAREEVPYEIDGMVVSVNNLEAMEELGELNMRPRGQIAWKFDPLMRETRIMDVRWQVGPTGRITPVASVEPVNVGGVTVTSISLHNVSLFRDLGLAKGDRVLVSRRNDVIPFLEKNLTLEEMNTGSK